MNFAPRLPGLQIALEIARNKVLGKAKLEFDRMETECLRLNLLIDEILEFARLDKSAQDLTLTEVNLQELLQLIIDDANYEFSGQTPRIVLQVKAQSEIIMYIDQRLLHRAIENILRNALRYSPENTIITVNMSIASDNLLHIDIDDQGPGIPEDELNKIFDPFYRVDTSREKKTGGYGLGLSIALKAVQLHNGTIQASNQHGWTSCPHSSQTNK